jgi:preprotein translocase subunit SecY
LATTNPAQKSGSRYADLKKRVLFLIGALIVYRIGTHIPVPGINAAILDELFRSQQGGILGLFNVFSGGALQRFSIFAGHHSVIRRLIIIGCNGGDAR